MTRIDFYILPNEKPNNRELLACRVTEKAYKLGHKVYIHTGSQHHSEILDDLLWTFRDGSFIPHELFSVEQNNTSPVLLGHADQPPDQTEILINLTQEVPGFFSRFDRVAELVDAKIKNKECARERFRFYKDRGYELQTHNL